MNGVELADYLIDHNLIKREAGFLFISGDHRSSTILEALHNKRASFMIKPIYSGENEDADTKELVESKAREYMEAERLQSDYGVVYRQYTTETFEGAVLWEPVTE